MDTSKVAGKLANEILRFMKKHKRGIMTTSAIVGVGLTAYTAIRGTVDAQEWQPPRLASKVNVVFIGLL